MPQEIERKFLVSSDAWRAGAVATPFHQGYLSTNPERTVRVRTEGKRGVITIKGKSRGATRSEYEYEIPFEEALEMIETLCEKPVIVKSRYLVEHEGHTWEIDEFAGENEGLIIAEVELESEDEAFARPDWLGQDVTEDERYYNSSLIAMPYSRW